MRNQIYSFIRGFQTSWTIPYKKKYIVLFNFKNAHIINQKYQSSTASCNVAIPFYFLCNYLNFFGDGSSFDFLIHLVMGNNNDDDDSNKL